MKNEIEIDVKWFGKAASDKVIACAMKGLKKGGEVVGGNAMNKCPVLSGTLKRSICVTEGGAPNLNEINEIAKPKSNRKKPIVLEELQGDEVAVYVSANTPYAHKQHENTSFSHTGTGVYYSNGKKRTYEKTGEAKFLERALQESTKEIEKLVGWQLKQL